LVDYIILHWFDAVSWLKGRAKVLCSAFHKSLLGLPACLGATLENLAA